MGKKVKINFNCDLEEVPKFCSINLEDTATSLKNTSYMLSTLLDDLKKIDPESLEDLRIALSNIEKIRSNLNAVDFRISDISSILIGLAQYSEKQMMEQISNKGNNNDNGNGG